MLCTRFFTLLTVGSLGFCQVNLYYRTPNTRAVVPGSKTISTYRLSADARVILGDASSSGHVLIRLPSVSRKAAPRLLGMLRHGSEIELFLGWVDPESQPGNVEHHIEIFRGRAGSGAKFLRDFTLLGGPGENVSFFHPPDGRDTPAVLLNIQGGAYWGTTYLVAPDRQKVDKLFDACDYEFVDLDRDGVYEPIAWGRRPFDVRCGFGIFAVRFYPEIFVHTGETYRKIWPPPDWAAPDGEMENRFKKHQRSGVPWGANFQIVAGFADLGGDDTAELIVLQDRLRDEPTQALAVYRLENKSFRLVAKTPLPPQRIAYLLSGTPKPSGSKAILVRTATRAKCEAGGDPDASGTAATLYILHGDHLGAVPPYRR
jgi:hypothetical protein